LKIIELLKDGNVKQLINQNVNYANHTNSSSPGLVSSTASNTSLATIIRGKTVIIRDLHAIKVVIKKLK
jgi:hypothetical protein